MVIRNDVICRRTSDTSSWACNRIRSGQRSRRPTIPAPGGRSKWPWIPAARSTWTRKSFLAWWEPATKRTIDSAVSRFLIGWCAVVNKSPDHGADAIMSRDSGLLAFTSNIVVKNKFTVVFRGVDSYLPRFTPSHGQNSLLTHSEHILTTENKWKFVQQRSRRSHSIGRQPWKKSYCTKPNFQGFKIMLKILFRKGKPQNVLFCPLVKQPTVESSRIVWFAWTTTLNKKENLEICALKIWPRVIIMIFIWISLAFVKLGRGRLIASQSSTKTY